MSARTTLIEGLEAAGVDVDATGTRRRYIDGVCYVLTRPASLTERVTLSVVAAVNVGQDIDAYADVVAAAIAGIDGMVALSSTPAYADIPVPGREMPAADLVRISVASDQLWA